MSLTSQKPTAVPRQGLSGQGLNTAAVRAFTRFLVAAYYMTVCRPERRRNSCVIRKSDAQTTPPPPPHKISLLASLLTFFLKVHSMSA